jgi:hypothetical protein
MFFNGIQDIIRGNGSSDSTRFPEGLVLGNWQKPFTLEMQELPNL